MGSRLAEIATFTLIGRNCRLHRPWRCFGCWFLIFLAGIGWGTYAVLHALPVHRMCG